jgi:hypothetical protein
MIQREQHAYFIAPILLPKPSTTSDPLDFIIIIIGERVIGAIVMDSDGD